jgi:hypothetical protein
MIIVCEYVNYQSEKQSKKKRHFFVLSSAFSVLHMKNKTQNSAHSTQHDVVLKSVDWENALFDFLYDRFYRRLDGVFLLLGYGQFPVP